MVTMCYRKAFLAAMDSRICGNDGTSLATFPYVSAYRSGRGGRPGRSYPDPSPDFEAIRGSIFLYPAQLECFFGSIRVLPQRGEVVFSQNDGVKVNGVGLWHPKHHLG
jgi:hypothetical protein